MKNFQDNVSKAIEKLRHELGRLRTGRANAAFVDGVQVNYYGTKTPLKQIANISTPDARTIQIQPWEAPLCKEVEKAILEANLGFTPNSDGKVVRISLPPMTEERRIELAKQVKKIGEEAKVGVRHARQEANNEVKQSQKDKEISEDDSKKKQDEIQKETDKFIKQVDEIVSKKTEEVQTI